MDGYDVLPLSAVPSRTVTVIVTNIGEAVSHYKLRHACNPPLKTSDGHDCRPLPSVTPRPRMLTVGGVTAKHQHPTNTKTPQATTPQAHAEALAPPGTNAVRQDQILWPDIMSVAHIIFVVAFDTNPLRHYLWTRAIELSTPEAH